MCLCLLCLLWFGDHPAEPETPWGPSRHNGGLSAVDEGSSYGRSCCLHVFFFFFLETDTRGLKQHFLQLLLKAGRPRQWTYSTVSYENTNIHTHMT